MAVAVLEDFPQQVIVLWVDSRYGGGISGAGLLSYIVAMVSLVLMECKWFCRLLRKELQEKSFECKRFCWLLCFPIIHVPAYFAIWLGILYIYIVVEEEKSGVGLWLVVVYASLPIIVPSLIFAGVGCYGLINTFCFCLLDECDQQCTSRGPCLPCRNIVVGIFILPRLWGGSNNFTRFY